MKRCPICRRTFEDDDLYCLDDGYALEPLEPPAANETPTQIVSPFRPQPVTTPPGNGGVLYFALGALGAGVIALGVALFFLLPGDRTAKAKHGSTDSTNSTANNAAIQPTGHLETEDALTPVLTQDSVAALVERWRISQNTRNFKSYQDCFDSSFFGIKRTKAGGPQRMNYGTWMNDRRKMLPNVIEVGVSNMQISFDGDTAVVRFDQRFRSVNHADDGLKELRVKMFPGGPRIVFEELKHVY